MVFLKIINAGVRKLSAFTHRLQMDVEWSSEPVPEWFDHYLDQYSVWPRSRNPLWVERGIFSLLAVRPGAKVLELCCGDGFNARYFYSIRAGHIIAVDFDPETIRHAKRFNRARNVQFKVCDIRHQIPGGRFDNIIWDGAVEHFTGKEINSIMGDLKESLGKNGILSGYTIMARRDGKKYLSHHEHEFTSHEDLLKFITPHFKNVKVFETSYPSRCNLYFYASDGVLPFDPDWPDVSRVP